MDPVEEGTKKKQYAISATKEWSTLLQTPQRTTETCQERLLSNNGREVHEAILVNSSQQTHEPDFAPVACVTADKKNMPARSGREVCEKAVESIKHKRVVRSGSSGESHHPWLASKYSKWPLEMPLKLLLAIVLRTAGRWLWTRSGWLGRNYHHFCSSAGWTSTMVWDPLSSSIYTNSAPLQLSFTEQAGFVFEWDDLTACFSCWYDWAEIGGKWAIRCRDAKR